MIAELEELLKLNRGPSVLQAPETRGAGEFLQALEAGEIWGKPFVYGSWTSSPVRAAMRRFVERPGLEARTALHFLVMCNDLRLKWVHWDALEHVQAWWESHDRAVDLLGFSRLWVELGGEGSDWFRAISEANWPLVVRPFAQSYFESQVPWILSALHNHERSPHLRMLAWFDPLPEQALPKLWEMAFGGIERELAQECLEVDPNKTQRLLAALADRNADVREKAAQWAARLRLQESLPVLSGLVAKEKVERVKIAQMSALETLGAPLESFLQRPALLLEARQILKKGVPQELEGLSLPALHWASDGQPVEPDLILSMVVQCLRLKTPEPSAYLVRVCSYWGGREVLGLELLQWWIDKDTVPCYSQAQIEELLPAATRDLRQLHQSLASMGLGPANRGDRYLEAEARRNLGDMVEGSAIALKGVLALVGACGGASAVDLGERYVKRWYGMRAAQCKALLTMVGHVQAPEAVQLLLRTAGRFRTKGIQEEAGRRLRERAQRLGWSTEDLADLDLPTAGLNESSALKLEFEGRTFTARLDDKFRWSLNDDEGRSLKALPEARSPEEVACSKRFKAAQKTVKDTHKTLRERLYDAMCSARWWNLETWQTSLNRHPLARHFCQALIWVADNGLTFRPCEDGSLVSADNDAVTLEEGSRVRLAHRADLEGAWHGHLADYLVVPPFDQMGRPAVNKPGSEFVGWMLGSFALRNRAKALGYERCPAEDGGVFMEYRKTLATSGWSVRIAFSGSQLPETDHPVALDELRFEREQRRASLAEVPDALYAEAYNDVRDIASRGSGYDPDWGNKVSLH